MALEQSPILIFLTIPYIFGLIVVSIYLYQGLKSKDRIIISKRTFLAWLYLILAILLSILVIIPASWQDRFMLLAFSPIALIVPIGVKYVDILLTKKAPSKVRVRYAVVGSITILFAFSSFFIAMQMFPLMGPTITMEQYQELELIKNNYIPDQLNTSGVIHVYDFTFGYWVKYVLDMDYITGNLTEIAGNYEGHYIYGIFQIKMVDPPFKPFFQYS
ncbi:MAG: hypothetical protein ACTSYB_04355 [Candidatus Helarchaeota archaeon]